MLEVRNLGVRAGKTLLLEDVSFTLNEGRICALLGANGSGKTSLIRALTSSYPRYQGSIMFSGHELRNSSKREKASLHALLPQDLPQVDIVVSSLFDDVEGGTGVLDELGLSRLAGRRLISLSGGERELVFLALMLSRKASLYCLDEAEANLDPRGRRLVERSMERLKREGHMVLASFHDIPRALRFADDCLVLDHGRLVFSGSVGDFRESGLATSLFGLVERCFTSEDGQLVKLLLEACDEDIGKGGEA